jgi:hypothetical protein
LGSVHGKISADLGPRKNWRIMNRWWAKLGVPLRKSFIDSNPNSPMPGGINPQKLPLKSSRELTLVYPQDHDRRLSQVV